MSQGTGARRMARTRLNSSAMSVGGYSTGRTRSRDITRCMKGHRMLQEGINQKRTSDRTKSRGLDLMTLWTMSSALGKSTYMTS